MGIAFRLQKRALCRMVNALLLFGICLFGAGRYLGIAQASGWNVVVGVGVILLLVAFDCMDMRGRLLGGAVLAGGVGSLLVIAGPARGVAFLINYGRWLFGISPWQQEWVVGYGVLQSILIALVCHLLQILFDRDVRIKAVAALLVLGGLVYCFFAEKEVPHEGVSFGICYLVVVLVELIQRHWKKVTTKSVQAYMLWLVPFLTLYLVALLATPVPEKPYDWKLFRDIYTRISESVKISSHSLLHMGREDFDSGLSGFSAEGTVGSKVRADAREIMNIQGSVSLRTNIYLTGKVYDTFDGRQWKKEKPEIAREREIDTEHIIYAVKNYDEEYQGDYLYRSKLAIRYEDFRSRYIFVPLKTRELEWLDSRLGYEEKDGSLLFTEKVGYGTEYALGFYQLNMGQEAFYEFLETMSEGAGTVVPGADMEAYEQAVYGSYLEELELSEKARQLVELATQNAETGIERLKAIEGMLSSMNYTHVPGGMPDTVVDGSSFLDYFLLESRQGFCSHFATAFVLLARAEGFPARYVQGYCVPMEADGEMLVTADRAHAWPEVYIDNVGWIPFEPTPGYENMRYTPWKRKKGEVTATKEYGQAVTLPEEKEEEQRESEWQQPETEDDRQETALSSVGKLFKMLLFAVVSVVIIGIGILLLDFLLNRWNYRRMNLTQKYTVEIRKNMKLLAWLQISRDEGETLEELGRRAMRDSELQKGVLFLEDYEEFLYGSRCVDAQMLHLAVEEQGELLKLLKRKRKWTYYFYRFFVR